MYFQTNNRQDFAKNYDVFKKKIKEEAQEKEEEFVSNFCIVCLEKTDSKLSEVSFKTCENQILEKKCACECYVHNDCLNTWILTKESCPICRDKLNILVFDDIFNGYPFILFYFNNEDNFINKFFINFNSFIKFTRKFYFYFVLTIILHVNFKIIEIIVKNI